MFWQFTDLKKARECHELMGGYLLHTWESYSDDDTDIYVVTECNFEAQGLIAGTIGDMDPAEYLKSLAPTYDATRQLGDCEGSPGELIDEINSGLFAENAESFQAVTNDLRKAIAEINDKRTR